MENTFYSNMEKTIVRTKYNSHSTFLKIQKNNPLIMETNTVIVDYRLHY